MKYKKKPVTIDAIQWKGESDVTYIKDWVESFNKEDWSTYFITGSSLKIITAESDKDNVFIVSKGDFIIRGVKGEYYACKPDVFEQTYVSAELGKDLFGQDIPLPPEPKYVYFKASTVKDDDGWMMCSAGNSGIDGNDWVVTTEHLKADEVPDKCTDAKTFCELVARLLNNYYTK